MRWPPGLLVQVHVVPGDSKGLALPQAQRERERPLNNGDFLIKFSPTGVGQLEADWQRSPVVPTLHPGESAPLYAVFGTRTPSGTLTLRSNDSYETVYASTTLTRP